MSRYAYWGIECPAGYCFDTVYPKDARFMGPLDDAERIRFCRVIDALLGSTLCDVEEYHYFFGETINAISDEPLLDCLGLWNNLFVSERVAQVLSATAREDVQLIPVRVHQTQGESSYYRVNCLRLIDAMNASDSVFHRYPSGQIGWLDKLVLEEEKLAPARLSRVVGLSLLVIRDDLKDVLNALGPTGLRIKGIEHYRQ